MLLCALALARSLTGEEEPVADVADDAVPSFQGMLNIAPSDGGADVASPSPAGTQASVPKKKKKKNRLIEPVTGQHSQPELAV